MSARRAAFVAVPFLALGLFGCAFSGGEAAAPKAAASQGSAAPLAGGDLKDATDLIASPRVQAGFNALEALRPTGIERLIALTEIAAPPFGEAERGRAVAQLFSDIGVTDVSTDAVGNVLARLPGERGGRTIAVVAHLDTVFPKWTDLTVQRDGNTYSAPGIGDNTRGLVMMLALAEVILTSDFRTADDILFVGSVGEEGLGDLRGVRHLFGPDGPRIDSFIAIDGGDVDRLVVDGVGSNRFKVMFKGPGGHSYGGFGRAHPHHALARAITDFISRATPITRGRGTKATFSVGRIGGGTSVNSIPFNAWMEVDMRSADPVKLAALETAFRDAVEGAVQSENGRRRSGDPLAVEIESIGRRPAGEGDRTAPLVRRAAAIWTAMGQSPNFQASSTDANIPISLGVPAVTISRGGVSRNAHAPNESWTDEGTAAAEKAALALILAEAGLID